MKVRGTNQVYPPENPGRGERKWERRREISECRIFAQGREGTTRGLAGTLVPGILQQLFPGPIRFLSPGLACASAVTVDSFSVE
jgi:hypothetical protein